MDQSLDEIIASRPRSRRRGAARAQVLGKKPPNPVVRAQTRSMATGGAANARATTTSTAVAATPQPADKIIVSNLPHDVNDAQIRELFISTVGPLRDVTLHYDAAGRFKGVAAVHFQRKGDGTKAYQQYNNRLIDGKRPMKIEIIVDPSKPAQAAPLVSRVAPLPAAEPAGAPAANRGGRGAGRGRRGRAGRVKGDRPAKSAADLDAEMEDYTATNTPTAAPVMA